MFYCKELQRLGLVLLICSAAYIKPATTKCTEIPSGMYCTNLNANEDNKVLLSLNNSGIQENEIQVVYLRNTTGKIDEETFSGFTNVISLDIQFCNIKKFSPGISSIGTLYLIYNSKLPVLSANMMKECCQNLSVLLIVGNSGLEIQAGTFKYLKKLTQLTISKQNITNLTREYFDSLENLSYLNLRENGILNIEEDAFENLKGLSHLILSYNNFTIFEPATFENVRVLEALELYGLNLTNFNISIFKSQTELKALELPTTLIKILDFKDVTKTLPKLETFGFLNEDKDDEDVAEFIEKCISSGYKIKLVNLSDL